MDKPVEDLVLTPELLDAIANGYAWIKVKSFVDDESLSFEERLERFKRHHWTETTFLIEFVRKLAKAKMKDG